MGKAALNLAKARAAQKEEARERAFRVDLERNPEIMRDLGINAPAWELGDGQAALYDFTEATDLQPIKDQGDAEAERKMWKMAYQLIGEQFQLVNKIKNVITTSVEWKSTDDPALLDHVQDRLEMKLLKMSAHSTRLLVRNWDRPIPGRLILDRVTGIGRFVHCQYCRDRFDRVSHDHPDIFIYDGPEPRNNDDFVIVYSWLFGFDKMKSVADQKTISAKMTEVVKCLVMQTFVDLDREHQRKKNREGVTHIELNDLLVANDYRDKLRDAPISFVSEMDRVTIDKSDPDKWRITEMLRPKQTQGIANSVGQGTVRDAMAAEHIALGNIMREELAGQIVWRVAHEDDSHQGLEEVAEIEGWATHPDRAVRDTIRWLIWLASEDSILEFTGEGYSRLKPKELSLEWSRMHNQSTGDHLYQCLYHCNNPIDPKHATGEEHECVLIRGGSELDMLEVNGIPLTFNRGVTEIQIGREFKINSSLIKIAMGIIHDGRKDYLGYVRLPSGAWSDTPTTEPKWSMIPPTLMQLAGDHKLRPGTGGSLYDSSMFTLRGYKHGNEVVDGETLMVLCAQKGLNWESVKSASHKVWNRHDVWSNMADERKYDRAWLAAQGYNVPIWSIRPRLGTQFESIESVLWLDGRPVNWSDIDSVWNTDFTPVDLRTYTEDDWAPMSESEMKARHKKGNTPERKTAFAALQARVDAGEIDADVAEIIKNIISN